MELIATLPGALARFHFLRPGWLLAVPVLLALAAWLARRSTASGSWDALVDAPLRAALRLSVPPRRRTSPWPWVALAWTVAALALAGPSWQREPTAAYAAPDGWVLVLDLSPSMSTPDVAPNRVARARYAIDDLLQSARDARIGLVVFGDEAYTVTPLTDDRATLRGLAVPLTPDLLPTPGDRIAPALAMAGDLLGRASTAGGRVVVLSDGFKDTPAALAAAQALAQRQTTLDVVALGDVDAGPAAVSSPASVATGDDGVEIRRVDREALQQLARAGRGRVFELPEVPQLIERLQARAGRAAGRRSEAPAERWRDAGVWLLPLAGVAGRADGASGLVVSSCIRPLRSQPPARPRWGAPLAGAAALMLAAATPAQGEALGSGWWRTPDQRGEAALRAGDAASAARAYTDLRRKAYAHLKAGEHRAAAQAYAKLDEPESHFNRGNALARAGELQQALQAYDTALARNPSDHDAQRNRDLVARALRPQAAPGEGDGRAPSPQPGGPASQPAASAASAPRATDPGADATAGAGGGGGSASPEGPPSGPPRGDQAPSPSAPVGPAGRTRNASGALPDAPAGTDDAAQAQRDVAGSSKRRSGKRDDADTLSPARTEQQLAEDQWLRRLPDDPGGLLRRKFMIQHLIRQGSPP